MEKHITDEQLIALLEGEPNSELEKQIETDETLNKRYCDLKEVLDAIEQSQEVEVPSRVMSGFQNSLQKEKDKPTRGPWMQIAAAVALLVIGFCAGKFSLPSHGGEISDLRDEIRALREVTLTSTLQKHSASERIMAVNQIEEESTVNKELVATLISTLNSDESPNVRYAALQALKKFIGQHDIRTELVKSLEGQSDPLIQISLITILVEAEERSAIAPLKDLIENQETSPEVKQQAEVALKVLT